jgi:Aromatic-ring-opening dioxygenase LigAB, LigA subunit
MNDHLNRAVERLLLDKRLLRRFRKNPEAALRRFGLSGEEIEAVKDGDARRLVGLGLDPSYVWPKARPPAAQLWTLARAKKLTPAFVLAALMLPASPALAARSDTARPSPVGRVSRFFARRGFGGEFHRRVARSGRAGEVMSRAATRRDASALAARARRAASDFGIQPPPVGEAP